MAGGTEFIEAVADIQGLQQALADPALALPLAGVGEKGVGLFGLVRQQAQVVGVIHGFSLARRLGVVVALCGGCFRLAIGGGRLVHLSPGVWSDSA